VISSKTFQGFSYLCQLLEFKTDFKRTKNGQLKKFITKLSLSYVLANFFKFQMSSDS